MPRTRLTSGADHQQHQQAGAGEADQQQRQREAQAGGVEHADHEAGGGQGHEQVGSWCARWSTSEPEHVVELQPLATIAAEHADHEHRRGRGDGGELPARSPR